MPFTITKRYTFAAAHRLEGHPKCGRLHGHNYIVIFELGSPLLRDGMIVDYGKIDVVVKPVIDEILDHRYLVSEDNIRSECPYWKAASQRGDAVLLPVSHTTAEELSAWLWIKVTPLIEEFAKLLSVTVCETEKTTATYVDEGQIDVNA